MYYRAITSTTSVQPTYISFLDFYSGSCPASSSQGLVVTKCLVESLCLAALNRALSSVMLGGSTILQYQSNTIPAPPVALHVSWAKLTFMEFANFSGWSVLDPSCPIISAACEYYTSSLIEFQCRFISSFGTWLLGTMSYYYVLYNFIIPPTHSYNVTNNLRQEILEEKVFAGELIKT